MPAVTATEPRLEKVGSHTVSLGSNFHGEIEREECYPKCRASWRGVEHVVELSADRYRHTGGWSDWRIYARRAFVPFPSDDLAINGSEATDTARHRLGEACVPLVEKWLDSREYRVSRQRAFAWMMRNHLRDERYSVDRSRDLLANYRDELAPAQRERLSLAVDTLAEFLVLIEA